MAEAEGATRAAATNTPTTAVDSLVSLGLVSVADDRAGLKVGRRYTRTGQDPYDTVEWEYRTAQITSGDGEVVFEQKDVEVPEQWSQLATNVVVSKYFRGPLGSPEREHSVRQLISRVADTISEWGRSQGYFASDTDAEAFRDELTYMLLHQMVSFNSPVWFNCGLDPKPQCSACFINSVEDNMESIMRLAATEARLFKGGSGAGSNLSAIRSSKEALSGGGTASGPVSFMKGYDAFAGVIKSGGKTRRAAKMVILNVDHPDIVEFINCKADEEKKAWALIEMGYDGSFNGVAYESIFFQNANHSVRVTDDFMRAVEQDGEWQTYEVLTGKVAEPHRARDLMNMIADATWVCGDPGMQFHDTINHWHTCSQTAPINASNPCSEYMFLDDSACNLASFNLLKFCDEEGDFDPGAFAHGCAIVITAMEIIVSNASYPTETIARNSEDYRPLGMGYANLGALLMSRGVPYDSQEARALAGVITALMTGAAYRTSAFMAQVKGPFHGFHQNRGPMMRVMRQHREAIDTLNPEFLPDDLLQAARQVWDDVIRVGDETGIRNAQATVIAPTGTIAFMMDCDTTGIEPDIALVKYKKLVGGGMMKIVNRTVPAALRRLGYSDDEIEDISAYLEEQETIEGAPHLRDEHLPVFDCAFRPANGTRFIHYMGHLRMMAAVQPFISGAISKTVNVPEDITVEEIAEAYMESWRLGLKAVAIYRDNSKRTQPLNTSRDSSGAPAEADAHPLGPPEPVRRRLPDERKSITHKFTVGGHEGYITVGIYEDGRPGEIFIRMAKEGSTVSGVMDCFATAISIALQYGVPLPVLTKKFQHQRFEPSGFTKNKDIPQATSIMDYIFRWLALKFPEAGANPDVPAATTLAANTPGNPHGNDNGGTNGHTSEDEIEYSLAALQSDAPPCPECGAITVRAGACYSCLNCGSTSGCG